MLRVLKNITSCPGSQMIKPINLNLQGETEDKTELA